MHVKPYVLALLLLLAGVAGTAVAQGGGGGAEAEGAPQTESMRILFFGDSITAGYGVGQEQAFPALVRRRIDSLDWNFTVVNGGLSGETSAGGLRRIDWVLRQHVDLFVLELGGNDGLRGIDLASTRQNLQQIIDKVGGTYPDARIVIAGMQVPPNLGPDYTARFESMYPELARENDAELIPFLMEGVGGFEEYMQNDGIHPNARGHERMAQTVWEAIRPILQEMRGS
ncbi:MAG: arylesterase [Balneolaceae bacterium]|nr:arylesterase [Balneolaceae bacterium]